MLHLPSWRVRFYSSKVGFQIRKHIRQTSVMEDADAPVFIDDIGLRNAVIPKPLHIPIGCHYDLFLKSLVSDILSRSLVLSNPAPPAISRNPQALKHMARTLFKLGCLGDLTVISASSASSSPPPSLLLRPPQSASCKLLETPKRINREVSTTDLASDVFHSSDLFASLT
jgi:hypothetical protein